MQANTDQTYTVYRFKKKRKCNQYYSFFSHTDCCNLNCKKKTLQGKALFSTHIHITFIDCLFYYNDYADLVVNILTICRRFNFFFYWPNTLQAKQLVMNIKS